MNIYLTENSVRCDSSPHGIVPVPWSEYRLASLPNCVERTQRCTRQAKKTQQLGIIVYKGRYIHQFLPL